MKNTRYVLFASAIAILLSGCNPGTTVATQDGSVRSTDDKVTLRVDGHPNAHIDVDGNLVIGGKPIEVTPQQRALLQEYQRELNRMTEQGVAVGKQGAAMAGTAVTAALQGVMGGDSESIDKTIEAQAELIKKEALKLCQRLVVIHGVQDRLAADLPAFKPYASIDMADIKDCAGSAEETVQEALQQVATSEAEAT